MLFTNKIQKAIRFSLKTHEVNQKQKRKGKDVPYVTHPLTVGLILARAGASEDVVVAGVLHDTIEDSVPEKKVTRGMLAERFGDIVADLVVSVSEPSKELPWEDRKQEAIEHIATFSHDSLLVKSADIISNASELIEDHAQVGDGVFARFNAPKDQVLKRYLEAIGAIIKRWPESPMVDDLRNVARDLQGIGRFTFMSEYPAPIIEYSEYDENMELQCPVCLWEGTPKESGWIEHHDDLMDVSCPNCEKMILVVSYPLAK